MIPLPMIRIESTWAKIGIDTQPGRFEIKQRPADLNLRTIPGKMTFHDPPARMEFDVKKAWEAFNGGSPVTITKRIASQMPDIVQQAIVKIAEKGHRMAAIHLPGNPIQQIAYQSLLENPIPIQYLGKPSSDNVDIEVTVEDFKSEFQPWEVQADVQTHPPEITFHRGWVKIYMEQYPSVKLIPPKINLLA